MERWGLPRTDAVYLAENGRLRLSVRVFGLPIERGECEDAGDGQCFRIPYERGRFDGLLDILDRDAFTLFREGQVAVKTFHAEGNEYIDVLDSEPLVVREGDIVVTKAERNRFERNLRLSEPKRAPAESLRQVNEYREVRIGEDVYHLGAIQARVVKHLHVAARSGNPWCTGKAVLAAAGSQSTRMADVFKSQPRWRRLIESNGRGHYRLVTGLDADNTDHPPAKT